MKMTWLCQQRSQRTTGCRLASFQKLSGLGTVASLMYFGASGARGLLVRNGFSSAQLLHSCEMNYL